jgi:hypothetical protein
MVAMFILHIILFAFNNLLVTVLEERTCIKTLDKFL